MNGYNLTTMEKLDMFSAFFNRKRTVIERKQVVAQEEAPARTNTAVKNNTGV